MSAFAHYRMEYFFRNQTLDAVLKPARYHLLMASDDERCRVTFEAAATHIRAVAAGNMHRDNIRTEAFTQSLAELLAPVEVERLERGEAPQLGRKSI